jgi:Xaa-Pro aminopeptidase
VQIRGYRHIWSDLPDLASNSAVKKVWLDTLSTSWAVHQVVRCIFTYLGLFSRCSLSMPPQSFPSDMVIDKSGPISLLKALKNDTELAGMRNCHIRDGAAVVTLLAWFV